MIRFVHCSAECLVDAAGRTVVQMQKALRDALNVSIEAFAYVGGFLVPEQYVLRSGDVVEFVFPYGEKGGVKRRKAPFPYVGGKEPVAAKVWERFGDVSNYVEPFCGSAAVLLNRPEAHKHRLEIVNDIDGFITNFWRSLKQHPEKVAAVADYPISELDFHARQNWLEENRALITERIRANENWCDPRVAAWWVWGMSQSIDNCFPQADSRVRPSVEGRCVHRLSFDKPRGERLLEEFEMLGQRLEHVRVLSGDWSRLVTKAMTTRHGVTGVFLDPPYTKKSGRSANLYAKDDFQIGHEVCRWAVANGDNPTLRIALCGWNGEYEIPPNWSVLEWKSQGSRNGHLERIWFSPHCLPASRTKAG